MDKTRLALMARRDAALAARDIPLFQSLTVEIAKLPMRGIPAPTEKSIERYVRGKKRRAS